MFFTSCLFHFNLNFYFKIHTEKLPLMHHLPFSLQSLPLVQTRAHQMDAFNHHFTVVFGLITSLKVHEFTVCGSAWGDSIKRHTLSCELQSWFHLLYGQTKASHDQGRMQTAPCCGFVCYSENCCATKTSRGVLKPQHKEKEDLWHRVEWSGIQVSPVGLYQGSSRWWSSHRFPRSGV